MPVEHVVRVPRMNTFGRDYVAGETLAADVPASDVAILVARKLVEEREVEPQRQPRRGPSREESNDAR